MHVLEGMCAGHPNKVIASLLDISEKTVKAHAGAIFNRLKVRNRTQAALVARRLGLATDESMARRGAHGHASIDRRRTANQMVEPETDAG